MRRRRERARTAATEVDEEEQRTAVLVYCGLFGTWAHASWAIEQPVAGTVLFVVLGGGYGASYIRTAAATTRCGSGAAARCVVTVKRASQRACSP